MTPEAPKAAKFWGLVRLSGGREGPLTFFWVSPPARHDNCLGSARAFRIKPPWGLFELRVNAPWPGSSPQSVNLQKENQE